MAFQDLITKIKKEISGKKAKMYATEISKFHRIQATKGFYDAAVAFQSYLTSFSYSDKDVEILEFESDGKTEYFGWPSPIGWEIEYGYLELVEPVKKKLCDFSETPTSVIVHSGSTPPDGFTGEVVYVGKGTEDKDYEGKDVKGKFVLTFNRSLLDVHEEAVVKRGAIGVISYQENIDAPEAVPYRSFWPTAREVESMKPGFSISFKEAQRMLKWMEEGKTVKVFARSKTRFYSSKLVVLTAKIDGAEHPEKEVIIVSHLCHPNPGANDNASGSALALELARVLKKLIDSKEVDPPKYTIRFLWVPEMFGTLAYIDRMKISKKDVIATINLDMVGEDQCKCKSTLSVVKAPLSIPTYLTALTQKITNYVAEMDVKEYGDVSGLSSFRYSFTPFIPGSDHYIFADSTFSVPSVAFIHWPDIFYHSSEDTTDKIDPFMISRVGIIALTLALILASPRSETLSWLLSLTFQYAVDFILDVETRIHNEKDSKVKVALYNSLDELLDWGINTLSSVSEAYPDFNIADEMETYVSNFRQIVANAKDRLASLDKKLKNPQLTDIEKELAKVYPKRVKKGPLFGRDLQKKLKQKHPDWFKELEEKDKSFLSKVPEIYNLMGKTRSLYNIYALLVAEYGTMNTSNLKRFVEFLASEGYLIITNKS